MEAPRRCRPEPSAQLAAKAVHIVRMEITGWKRLIKCTIVAFIAPGEIYLGVHA
jgi:hypothetical protein